MTTRRRIGLLGQGYIGKYVLQRLLAEPELGYDVAFVWNRDAAKLAHVPAELRLTDLNGMAARKPDLVVEMAHPALSRDWGARILAIADYMPLSVTAMAEPATEQALLDAATRYNHRLCIPHGALIGVDNLAEGRGNWIATTITFRKHPKGIDFADSGFDPAGIAGETLVYDGPARGIAMKFPRNVNTMVTAALASVGLDKCRARLIADPALTRGILELEAVGADGSVMRCFKSQPMVGVSGTEMLVSQFGSILRVGAHVPGLVFV